MNRAFIALLPCLWAPPLWSIQNVYNRPTTSLNGNWHVTIDSYETGYRDNRIWRPFDEADSSADSVAPYWANRKMENPWDRIEYEFDEYWMYEETIQMLRKTPSLRGMSPWILVDFRSPRRDLPSIQDGWNRKGLISNQGFKKKAFYQEMAKRHDYEIR